MSIPLQISFLGMTESAGLRASVEKYAAKLGRHAGNILGCHVVIEPSERSRHQGNRYRVHVQLKLPGEGIHVSRDPAPDNRTAEDAYVAVRDAFGAARRQLERRARKPIRKTRN